MTLTKAECEIFMCTLVTTLSLLVGTLQSSARKPLKGYGWIKLHVVFVCLVESNEDYHTMLYITRGVET